MFDNVFSPQGANVSLTVGVASANVLVTSPVSEALTIRLVNLGANLIHVAFGVTGVTVTAPAGLPIGPNTDTIFMFPALATHVAAISGAAGNTLHCQVGRGV